MPIFGTTKKPSGDPWKHQRSLGKSSDFTSTAKPGTTSQGNGGPAKKPHISKPPKKF